MYVRIINISEDGHISECIRLVSAFSVERGIDKETKQEFTKPQISFVEPLQTPIYFADPLIDKVIRAMFEGEDQIWVMLHNNTVWMNDEGVASHKTEWLYEHARKLNEQWLAMKGAESNA